MAHGDGTPRDTLLFMGSTVSSMRQAACLPRRFIHACPAHILLAQGRELAECLRPPKAGPTMGKAAAGLGAWVCFRQWPGTHIARNISRHIYVELELELIHKHIYSKVCSCPN